MKTALRKLLTSRRMMSWTLIALMSIFLPTTKAHAGPGGTWQWWPTMAGGSSVTTIYVVTPEANDMTYNYRDTILLESMAGLAAKAVNNGTWHALIYVVPRSSNTLSAYNFWLSLLETRLGSSVTFDTTHTSATLLPIMYTAGVISGGYDEYNPCGCTPPTPSSTSYEAIDAMDHSLNVATMDAGLYVRALFPNDSSDASWVTSELNAMYDGESPLPSPANSWSGTTVPQEESYWTSHLSQFNNTYALVQPMSNYEMRDMAIAFGVPVFYVAPGPNGTAPQYFDKMMSFLATAGADASGNPTKHAHSQIGNVWGWDDGVEEATFVQEISYWGNNFVPTETGMNLPVLSSGRASVTTNQVLNQALPSDDQVEYNVHNHASNSFVMTDGDNLAYALGLYVNQGKYWDNPESGVTCTPSSCPSGSTSSGAGKVAYGYGIPAGDLYLEAPDAWGYFVQFLPTNANIVSGPGYIYPDIFGAFYNSTSSYSGGTNSPNVTILTSLSSRLNSMMQATGVRTLTFLCRCDSAQETVSTAESTAYSTMASQMTTLDAAYIIWYSPYDGGDGNILWETPSGGTSATAPFITAAYSVWLGSSSSNQASPCALAGGVYSGTSCTPSEPNQLGASQTMGDIGGVTSQLLYVDVHAWDEFGNYTGTTDPNAVADQHGDSTGNGWSVSAATMTQYWAGQASANVVTVTPEAEAWGLRYLQYGGLPY